RLGVKGWVRNRPDGSVECVAEGDEERVKELIQWSHHGPPGARVERVKVQWEEYRGDLKGFEIRY
ncbi:MAG: acylphosphatase, partial [Deltaproteobacteria bacterium]